MDSSGSGSVTAWIVRLKTGDENAAERLCDRYFQSLVGLARVKLGKSPRIAADEEDVALNVFEILCRGAASGRLDRVANRDDLWWLLLAITNQQAINQKKHETRQRRGGGQVKVETDLADEIASDHVFSLDDLASNVPTPEFLTLMAEQHQRLLERLRDDRLRQIALWRMEGYKNTEIAEKLGISIRAIERKLGLIRSEWTRELGR